MRRNMSERKTSSTNSCTSQKSADVGITPGMLVEAPGPNVLEDPLI